MNNVLYGINTVTELINSGKKIETLFVSGNKKKLHAILTLAQKNNVKIQHTQNEELDKITGNANHQGIVAKVIGNTNPTLEEDDLFALPDAATIVILDGITDPHNLGAILRSCDVFGVNAVVLPKDNSAKINDTVFKTSSGAASYVTSVTVTNLNRTIEKLKQNGFWVYGADINGEKSPRQEKFPQKTALIIGSEGSGMKRLVKENCDILLKIPASGHVDSLNASNAAAVLLYEIYVQKNN